MCFICRAVLDFDDKPVPDENSKPDPLSDLTLELIDAIIVFLELASQSDQHKKKLCTRIHVTIKLMLKDFVLFFVFYTVNDYLLV
jgi:hypothetical protein